MPEIKHTFQHGKMNKDLDERIVPNGEYRDAMNIQVRTTDGDAAGTVQNLQGNYGEIAWGTYIDNGIGDSAHCLASVADEKNDKAYFFFVSPDFSLDNLADITSTQKFMDTIVEHDTGGNTTPVFVDLWTVAQPANFVIHNDYLLETTIGGVPLSFIDGPVFIPAFEDLGNSTGNVITEIQVIDSTPYKIGMTIEAYGLAGVGDDGLMPTTNLFEESYTNNLGEEIQGESPIIKDIQIIDGVHKILFHEPVQSSFFDTATHFIFRHDKVLNFKHRDKWITGINVIDDLLFWTDNSSEPKKINIKNCIAGTASDYSSHTDIFVEDNQTGALVNISTIDDNLGSSPINSKVQEKNITVIKRSPNTAPTLDMKKTLRDSTENAFFYHEFANESDSDVEFGDIHQITDDNFTVTNFRKDDVITIEQVASDLSEIGLPIILKAKFVSYLNSDNEEVLEVTDTIKIIIMGVNDPNDNIIGPYNWKITLELPKPLFERKMVRFGYRYKYEDGEYSTFSPWSELAFLPSEFDYNSKEAYNLGMVNSVRQLIIKDFIPYKRPLQVKEIDILYKATDSANVYIAATITRNKSNEWELFTPDGVETIDGGDGEIKTGQLTITSEMVHRALPSTQILRGWDNVPRRALSQEITGNRLIYGNYTQGYDIKTDINLLQEVISSTPNYFPQKSIKSIRDYKIGMVFGDKYGRETPVMTSGYFMELADGVDTTSGDITIDKSLCAVANSFKLTLDWDDPPNWLQEGGYVKYYVKETSNEYYNLVMDRWYDSGDDTIWLSFNSADRNKVDEETYLLLKNKNGSNEPVLEKARYKIISIKNEAPDYIKTEYQFLGEINDLQPPNAGNSGVGVTGIWGEGPDYTGNDVEADIPYGFWGQEKTMMIPYGQWNEGSISFIGTLQGETQEHVFGRQLDGFIEMRVTGKIVTGGGIVQETKHSGWRRISHYSRNADGVNINWKDAFSENATNGANMFQAFNCPACSGLQYSISFREGVVRNKPEFDGKFFVKIAKDDVLAEGVMAGAYNYTSQQVINLSYIESATKNQTQFNGGTMADTSIPLEANFNTSDATNPANDWFYGRFAGFVNLSDGSVDSNNTFGLARWNIDNGGGTHEIDWSPNYWDDNTGTMYNDGIHMFENPLGGNRGDIIGDSTWYWWNGTDYNEPGHSHNFNNNFTEYSAMEDMGGQNDSPTPGFPFPNNWNFNYFASQDIPTTHRVYNRQYPTWWGHNEVQESEQGPSWMGQLCGPIDQVSFSLSDNEIDSSFPFLTSDYSGGPYRSKYEEATRQFWEDYSGNNGSIFIDAAGARRAFGGPVSTPNINRIYKSIQDEAWDGLPSKGQATYDLWADGEITEEQEEYAGYVDFYKHPGMDRGIYQNFDGSYGVPNGEVGRIFLGYLLENRPSLTSEINNMLSESTVFSFPNAPLDENGNVIRYKVIFVDNSYLTMNYSAISGDGNQEGGYGNGTNWGGNRLGFRCEPCLNPINGDYNVIDADGIETEGLSEGCVRVTTAIEFRRIDPTTNMVTTSGMDVSTYDPRAWLQHDGKNSIYLSIDTIDQEVDITGNSINNHLGACWETEPKESVDVDLYYEASNALPMVINKDNAFDFIQPNANVSFSRQIGTGVEKLTLNHSDHRVNNVYHYNDSPIVSITCNLYGNRSLFKDGIKINDFIHFHRSDGLITTSKVIGFSRPIYGDDVMHEDLNTDELSIGAVDNPRAFQDTLGQETSLDWSYSLDQGYDVYSDPWFVVPNNIPINDLIGAQITSVEQIIPPGNPFQNGSNVYNVFTPDDWVVGSVVDPSTIATYLEAIGYPVSTFDGYNILTISNISGNGMETVTSLSAFYEDEDGNFVGAENNQSYIQMMGGGTDVELVFAQEYQQIYSPNITWNIVGSTINIAYQSRTGYYEIDPNVWKYPVELNWFNCYTFGNGVESDRVRDDFNAPQIDNGVRVSTTFSGYGEENKSSGMIYSGLYNSTSEVNDLNEFNMSEKITKDLNPSYGSIQRLKTRDTDLIALAEDKVLKVLANKDAVFNADGNPQLTATNRVLGQAIPFVGDYGISKNPESLAWDQYRLYFTDTQRGAVLRLSRDGLTPISNVGMKTWFRDNIAKIKPNRILGTFDTVSGEYNATIVYGNNNNPGNTTVSFNEAAKGWVSFKSFIPDHGVSVSGKYITTKDELIYHHHAPDFEYVDGINASGILLEKNNSKICNYNYCADRNTFYGIFEDSWVDIVFNETPEVVKSFKTINYEGSQAKVTVNQNDNEYYNLIPKQGWWASDIETDLQQGNDVEFKDKENKWFNHIKGEETSLANLDSNEFSVQGIGIMSSFVPPSGYETYVNESGEEITYEEAVYGCMDMSAFNYNADANIYDPNGVLNDICCYISGCMDESAFNYDSTACSNDQDSCLPWVYSCGQGGLGVEYGGVGAPPPGFGVYPDVNGNNASGSPVDFPSFEFITGIGTTATGYTYIGVDPTAHFFSQEYCSQSIGCWDPNATNYDPTALYPCSVAGGLQGNQDTQDILEDILLFTGDIEGTCCQYVYGCMDPIANNYNPDAVFENNPSDCEYVYGCMDSTLNAFNEYMYINYSPDATSQQVSAEDDSNPCILAVYGCMDPEAGNFDETANVDDGSCEYYYFGCGEPTTTLGDLVLPNINYDDNPLVVNDGSCIYELPDTVTLSIINYPDDSNAQVEYDPLSNYWDNDGDGIADQTQ